jgi:hypothetical protein
LTLNYMGKFCDFVESHNLLFRDQYLRYFLNCFLFYHSICSIVIIRFSRYILRFAPQKSNNVTAITKMLTLGFCGSVLPRSP